MTEYAEQFNNIFQVITDIHLETYDVRPNFKEKWPKEKPCLILSGDIGHLTCQIWHEFMDYVNGNWDVIVYVLGNHEFYSNDRSMSELLEQYKRIIGEKWNRITLLNNEAVGVTWNDQTWTIVGSIAWGSADYSIVLSINDFKKIKTYDNSGRLKSITVKEYQELHNRDMQFILDELSYAAANMPIVLVTHFPLTRERTNDIKYENEKESIKKYYANELHDKIKGNTRLTLVAGHTHHNYDFIMDEVRYIGNHWWEPAVANVANVDNKKIIRISLTIASGTYLMCLVGLLFNSKFIHTTCGLVLYSVGTLGACVGYGFIANE